MTISLFLLGHRSDLLIEFDWTNFWGIRKPPGCITSNAEFCWIFLRWYNQMAEEVTTDRGCPCHLVRGSRKMDWTWGGKFLTKYLRECKLFDICVLVNLYKALLVCASLKPSFALTTFVFHTYWNIFPLK